MAEAPSTITSDTKHGITKAPSAHSADTGAMEKEAGHAKTNDIAEGLYREIDNFTPEELEAEQIRVRKLIDWRIMPIVS